MENIFDIEGNIISNVKTTNLNLKKKDIKIKIIHRIDNDKYVSDKDIKVSLSDFNPQSKTDHVINFFKYLYNFVRFSENYFKFKNLNTEIQN